MDQTDYLDTSSLAIRSPVFARSKKANKPSTRITRGFAQMTQLPVERPQDMAANEDFTGTFKRPALTHEGGWDPYQVWRTRVKAPALLPRKYEGKTRAPQPRGF